MVYCAGFVSEADCMNPAVTIGKTFYYYDGEGRRVGKVSGAVTEAYVYDARGQLAAEYGGPTVETATHYVTADHLGSTRVITDSSKAVLVCKDYLPFGDEILANTQNARSGIACYSGETGLRQKFTGKERDPESRLDFFGARYYSWAQGRFTSPDPFNPILESQPESDDEEEQERARQAFEDYISNPQHWNRYVYALNNPLAFKDVDGKVPIPVIIATVGALAASPAGQRAIIMGSAYLYRYGPQLQSITLTSGRAISTAVFTLGPVLRGRVVDALSGTSRAFGNFPTLDRFAGGTALSRKTIDAFAQSYQRSNALFSKLAGYVDELGQFPGASRGGADVPGEKIQKRVLEIIVPKGGIREYQRVFQQTIEYARRRYKDLEIIYKELE